MAAGAIYLGDFDTVESKVLAEKEIFNKIAPKVGSWAYRSYKKTLLPPYRTATFRTIVFPDAPDPTAAVLVEGVKPDPTGSLTIVERTMFTKPYGFYETYSDELANFSFDNLVPRLVEGVALKARLFVDKIAAEAWKGGNQVYEVTEGGLTREIISKIRISLRKLSMRKDAEVHCVISPEDMDALIQKYNVGNANLFVDTTLNEDSVKNAKLVKFAGVYFEEDDSDIMYTEGKRNAYFYILDSEGRTPVGLITADNENGEFIAKGLHEGGADENPLNQKGSVGVKFKGLGAILSSEECLCRCEITATDTVASSWNYETAVATANGTAVEPKNQDGTAATVKASK